MALDTAVGWPPAEPAVVRSGSKPNWRIGCAILLSWVLLSASWPARAGFTVPPLRGAVNDYAGMLDPQAAERLDQALRRLWNSGGSQIAVLTVADLGGESIEQASIKVTDQWRLGRSKVDNGVLILVAKADRKVRIEVGQGLEGVLPDAYARRVVSDVMIPYFKANDPTGGVIAGVKKVVSYTDPSFNLQLGAGQDSPPDDGQNEGLPLPFLVVLILFILFFSHRFGRRIGWWGGPWGGGGGGSSGGGFSGGGGGFSGGGASDSW